MDASLGWYSTTHVMSKHSGDGVGHIDWLWYRQRYAGELGADILCVHACVNAVVVQSKHLQSSPAHGVATGATPRHYSCYDSFLRHSCPSSCPCCSCPSSYRSCPSSYPRRRQCWNRPYHHRHLWWRCPHHRGNVVRANVVCANSDTCRSR
jgi:hypothetical protein